LCSISKRIYFASGGPEIKFCRCGFEADGDEGTAILNSFTGDSSWIAAAKKNKRNYNEKSAV
jgi:hypothetical protein